MALPAPIISYQDGAAAAAVNLAANTTAYVTSGNALTVLLQSTTGVVQAEWTVVIQGLPIATTQSYRWTPGTSPAGFTIALPPQPCSLSITTEVSDGNNVSTVTNLFVCQALDQPAVVYRARGVSAANNESLTAFVGVTGGTIRDGVTYVQGDVVLLAGQTTKTQNGLYVVGVVAAGTAPLTRLAAFATGAVFPKGASIVCELGPEGTLFGGTLWKVTTAGPITVDTTNHDWYPRQVTQQVTLVTGFVTVTNVPILSTTKTAGIFMPTNFSGASTTVSYRNGAYTSGGAATAAGIAGTGSISVTALVAAGTFNTNDVGTGSLTIVNF